MPNVPAQFPAVPNSSVDPFAAPGQPAVYNGRTYNNLPAGLAAQVAALGAVAPMPALHQHRSRRAPENPAPAPAPLPPPVRAYPHLPEELAMQMAALHAMPAMPQHRNRQAPHNPAPFPMPPPIQPGAPPPVEPDELPPPPVNANALPEARQPFNRNWPVHSLGKMDVECRSCKALHWMDEQLVKSSKKTPIFGMCCTSGKIKLPKLANPPGEILNLLSGQDHVAKQFCENI